MTWDRVKEARRRLAGEQGAIRKDWGGKLPVALIYPNSYYLGMSNLGIHAIYAWLNAQPDIVCERVFYDRDEGEPPLSIESQRPLTDFAVLAFSITYELDYFSVPALLRASGIPMRAAERDETHPITISGGACMTANPAPLAPFFDCVCVGEAEAILPRLLPVLRQAASQSMTRRDALSSLSSLPGIYVPLQPAATVWRQWTKDLDEFPVHSAVLTPDTELGDMYLIEVERGCPWGCRFCLVGGAFSPMRLHSLESLLEQAQAGLKHRRRLGLMGPDVPDHPRFAELVAALKAMGADISISSLRIKPLHPMAFGEIARATDTVAFAPEAGSERLRGVIRKGITEEDVMRAMDMAADHGIKRLRLYFMIGLPTETDADVEAIGDLALKCKARLERKAAGTGITLSVSPFVPKAGTPFQWMPMERLDILNRRLGRLRGRLQSRGVRVSGESPGWSEVQAVLARGDESLASVLEDIQGISLPAWRGAMRKHGIDTNRWAHTRWEPGSALPWGMIESGRDAGYLQSELGEAEAPA